MNIFAVGDNIVQSFYVTMNEELLKVVQKKIDNWYGKGEIKEVKAASLFGVGAPGKRIEVVSKRYLGKGEVFYYCCPAIESVDIYNYKFYEYSPHPLSKLCDNLLKDFESLDYSKHLAELLSWDSDNKEEMLFVKELISTFKFKKINIKDLIQNDSTNIEKRTILKSFIERIKKVPPKRTNVLVPKSYDESVENKIADYEAFNSGFYSRELNGCDFKYTEEQKRDIKKRILKTLPTVDSINNIIG